MGYPNRKQIQDSDLSRTYEDKAKTGRFKDARSVRRRSQKIHLEAIGQKIKDHRSIFRWKDRSAREVNDIGLLMKDLEYDVQEYKEIQEQAKKEGWPIDELPNIDYIKLRYMKRQEILIGEAARRGANLAIELEFEVEDIGDGEEEKSVFDVVID